MALVTATSVNMDLSTENRVVGYYLYDENEKEICDIRDLLVEEKSRIPRYIVIEVGGMLSIQGKKLLIPWTSLIRRGMSRMDIQRSLDVVMGAPSPAEPANPTRVEEESIHFYFQAEPYWLLEEYEEEESG